MTGNQPRTANRGRSTPSCSRRVPYAGGTGAATGEMSTDFSPAELTRTEHTRAPESPRHDGGSTQMRASVPSAPHQVKARVETSEVLEVAGEGDPVDLPGYEHHRRVDYVRGGRSGTELSAGPGTGAVERVDDHVLGGHDAPQADLTGGVALASAPPAAGSGPKRSKVQSPKSNVGEIKANPTFG